MKPNLLDDNSDIIAWNHTGPKRLLVLYRFQEMVLFIINNIDWFNKCGNYNNITNSSSFSKYFLTTHHLSAYATVSDYRKKLTKNCETHVNMYRHHDLETSSRP